MTATTRVAQMVRVELLQDDMVGFEGELPFPVQTLHGKTLFTEKVIWGEIWLIDRGRRNTRWAGYVRDGELYLDQSSRRAAMWNRKHQLQKPTLLPVGKYKVWLDAWMRMDSYTYTNDSFTRDAIDGDGGPWTAPRPPLPRFWQDVEVAAGGRNEPCRLRVRSRRFHWLYRVARIAEALRRLLDSHDALMQKVDEAKMMAEYLRHFLYSVRDSHANDTLLQVRGGDRRRNFEALQDAVRNVSVHCENFIRYGVCDSADLPLPERKHINNVAELLWRLLHVEAFAREMKAWDAQLAEEHRLLIANLGFAFNRVPRLFSSVTRRDAFSVVAEGESFRYGEAFAREFALPHINKELAAAGATPMFRGAKPARTLDIVNSCRRYGISMLNAASIFVVRSLPDPSKAKDLLKLSDRAWNMMGTRHAIIERANELIDEYRKAGEEAAGVFQRAQATREIDRLRNLRLEQLTKSPLPDTEVMQLRKARILELEKQLMQETTKPEKLVDKLKGTSPATVYGIQMFEIFVKTAVAISAWGEFQKAMREADSSAAAKKGVTAGLKTVDAAGSAAQFLGLQHLLQTSSNWKAAAPALQKLGKGLGAVGELGSAALYSWDIFADESYGDDLLEKYLPEDAVTMYAFHLVTWGGKVIVATGSSAAVFSKAPIFAKLQAIGYLAQLIGEAGEAFAKHGAAEKAHFVHCHRELVARVRTARHAIEARGWSADLYPVVEQANTLERAKELDWPSLDADVYRARLSPPAD